VVERIRRERYAPRPTQPDYLHLRGIRRALAGAFAALPPSDAPALDLFCGTQPYRAMVPRRAVVGVDRDRHFARADVVADLPLPFADAAFSLVVCTQALHLVDDPPAAVREMARVLAPGGHAVVTVPHLLRREVPAERMLSAGELRALFAGWEVALRGVDGPGNAAVYLPASLALGAARRWPALRPALPPLGLTLTAAGVLLEAALWPLARRWPAGWLVVARRPAG
jgi:SAM-dependent methyltransferase